MLRRSSHLVSSDLQLYWGSSVVVLSAVVLIRTAYFVSSRHSQARAGAQCEGEVRLGCFVEQKYQEWVPVIATTTLLDLEVYGAYQTARKGDPSEVSGSPEQSYRVGKSGMLPLIS